MGELGHATFGGNRKVPKNQETNWKATGAYIRRTVGHGVFSWEACRVQSGDCPGKSRTKTLQPLMSKIKQQGIGSLESGVRSKGLIFVVCSDPVLCILQHFLGALHFPLTCVLACWLAGFCRDQLQVPTRRETHQPAGKRTNSTGNAPIRRETHQTDGKRTNPTGNAPTRREKYLPER